MNLERAVIAESEVRAQKDMLAIELEKQSAKLRQSQLKEVQQLYKFAALGQSTAATLHELSNHLSVLNLDISDIKEKFNNSKIIKSTEESINHINSMLVQARKKLNNYDIDQTFNAVEIVSQSYEDAKDKFTLRNVTFHYINKNGPETFFIKGDPLALHQIVDILINNALDASTNVKDGKVVISISLSRSSLCICVEDNGSGIPEDIKSRIFDPKVSKKVNGLGIGLHIAKHLAMTQFCGDIHMEDSTVGAKFNVVLPRGEGCEEPKQKA